MPAEQPVTIDDVDDTGRYGWQRGDGVSSTEHVVGARQLWHAAGTYYTVQHMEGQNTHTTAFIESKRREGSSIKADHEQVA